MQKKAQKKRCNRCHELVPLGEWDSHQDVHDKQLELIKE